MPHAAEHPRWKRLTVTAMMIALLAGSLGVAALYSEQPHGPSLATRESRVLGLSMRLPDAWEPKETTPRRTIFQPVNRSGALIVIKPLPLDPGDDPMIRPRAVALLAAEFPQFSTPAGDVQFAFREAEPAATGGHGRWIRGSGSYLKRGLGRVRIELAWLALPNTNRVLLLQIPEANASPQTTAALMDQLVAQTRPTKALQSQSHE
ncbi:MAG: hypothetical protein R3336_04975 [Phycisphaeraceae bacterium]|nr:hypothetical protein [Phycisphaeraceae bacterium]